MRFSAMSLLTTIGPEMPPTRSIKSLIRLLHFVASLEPLDATPPVNNPLLAGEERVATAADLDAEHGPGSLGLPFVAAGAVHGGVGVVRVDLCFHPIDSCLLLGGKD